MASIYELTGEVLTLWALMESSELDDEKRLNLLREAIKECEYEKQDDENVKRRVSKDPHGID